MSSNAGVASVNSDKSGRPSNKVLAAALGAAMLALVGTAAILIYLGLFSSVTVTKVTTPGYFIAYLSHAGSYSSLQGTFAEVESVLGQPGAKPLARCAVLMDDPSVTPEEELRSKVGVIALSREELPSSSLIIEEIPPTLVAQVKFNGSPVVGSYKAYAAIKQWGRDTGYTPKLPALEIYYDDGSVEYQLPISGE